MLNTLDVCLSFKLNSSSLFTAMIHIEKFCKHWEATCVKNLILQALLCDRYNYYKETIQKKRVYYPCDYYYI